jgi:hypothetical protein
VAFRAYDSVQFLGATSVLNIAFLRNSSSRRVQFSLIGGDRPIPSSPQQTQATEVIEGEAEEGDRLGRDKAIEVGIKAAVG